MSKLPIGVQVYSVRDDASADFRGTMQKLKAMGYDGVELAGLYDIPAEEIRDILKEVGLVPVSAHVGLDELLKEEILDQYVTIGCKYVAVPWLAEELRPAYPEAFLGVLEKVKKAGELCKKKGLILLYHNHDFEFVKMPDGRYGLDYMYETIPADLLQTELDTCWVNVGGENPAAYIKKYAGRCPVVHLKDFFMEGAKPKKMYELIGLEDDEEEETSGDRSTFEFRPVGHGLQDIPAIVTAAEESGAQWLIVEQDRSEVRPPLEAVEMSIKYLKG